MSTAAPVEPGFNELAGGPLSSSHRHELKLARGRAAKIRRAAAVAGFNGWATAMVAMLSAPFALFSMSALVTTLVLSAIAWNEFRGRKRLLRFDPSSAALLGWNQLSLLAMIIAYSLWTIYSSLYGTNSITTQLQGIAELEAALGSLDDIDALCRQLVVAMYVSIIALSVAFQGLNAIYYFTRRRHVEEYIAQTPEWIRDLQRMMPPR